jgi:hypothetical protein
MRQGNRAKIKKIADRAQPLGCARGWSHSFGMLPAHASWIFWPRDKTSLPTLHRYLVFSSRALYTGSMEYVESLDQLEEKIHEENAAVFVFFYRESDNPGVNLMRPILNLGKKYQKIASFAVDLDVHPTAAGLYIAYKLPSVALYYNGHLVFMKNEPLLVPEIDAQLRKLYKRL